MSQDGLTYIKVFRPDGSLLTNTLGQNETGGTVAVGMVESVLRTQEPVLEFHGDDLEVTSPITAGNQLLAIVHFDLSTASLHARLMHIIWDHVWQGLALLAVATLLSFGVARFVTKPLQALRTAALSIGMGNLEERIPVGGPEETASLGQALSSMRTELKGLYQDLEGQVAERTEELTVLYDISRILSQLADFESKATKVMERLAQLTGAEWVTLRQERHGEPGLRLVAAAGSAVTTTPPMPVLTNTEALAYGALREGTLIVAND